MAERTLHTPLTDLPGVGPARARALDKLGLSTVADLLAYFPREYEDRTVREGIAWLPADTPVCFAAVVAEPLFFLRDPYGGRVPPVYGKPRL